ncbi:uncharacterized protein MONOS_13 [Monocercomonoides exilis]|uniref:uncharacterized protein n=1 Tax=Monocercomonoides exilis TaxID=2049356 RepID=UPI003559A924|nr:hypothetical protein MONOS_13 [Monocercomonoides exilis]|eukprot:MONOS_13.1-p1 / transcript=MONOS_13.1 / gene=MONOS_13 / organism=Monocercomonoides_exilis_PA203 / gene_product=unspecified product / transcript_product=unspecified product / location=Mono_scaffold00001:27896-28690(+) / protein_length=265 / sequence_SO=supercontig / SO=protein_coding / is_pseudo=false
MDIENTATGPASGLGSIFTLSGLTGGVGLSQPTSSSSVPPMQPAQFSSGDTSSDSSPNGKNIFAALCRELFGSETSQSIFDLKIDSPDIADTVSFYESFSYTPFIPSKVHEFARSSNWIKDALNSSGWRVERYLIQAVKALILTHADAPEKQERLYDEMMLVISGLQEARHSRIQAEYGFAAAKVLRVETEDPIVSGKKLSKIKPFLEARRARSQPSQHQLHNRRRFFRLPARSIGPAQFRTRTSARQHRQTGKWFRSRGTSKI